MVKLMERVPEASLWMDKNHSEVSPGMEKVMVLAEERIIAVDTQELLSWYFVNLATQSNWINMIMKGL